MFEALVQVESILRIILVNVHKTYWHYRQNTVLYLDFFICFYRGLIL